MQPQRGALFRKAALEKLSSPEQLDVLMRVTTPKGWLALTALGCVLALVVAWGIFGSIATRVDGRGILLRGEAVLDVTASSSGRLAEILVAPGDVIEEGQVIATIRQEVLGIQINNLRETVAELEGQDREQRTRESANLELSRRALAEERASQESAITDQQTLIGELEKKIVVQEELVGKGLITENTLLGTRQQLAAAQQAITRSQVRIAQISSEETALERQVQQLQTGRLNRIDDLRRQLEEQEMKLASSIEVRSPYAGRVLELMTDAGNLVGPGARMLTLEALGQEVEGILYVPAGDGKKVRPGMEVRISPSTVKVEEYGFILGEVISVSEFPVTPEGLRRVLRNETLLSELGGDAAPIEVVARLGVDPSTPSGYRWSSSTGPPTQVFSGTICTASVVVESRRPIELVLPKIRQALGVG
ncbi:MAG: NHLP bacteriocin system secretion protein [Acidobacteriota bacterium]